MARYDRGYDRSLHPASGDWARPFGSRRGMRYDRHHAGERPWVGGYQEGFQGGSSGIPVGGRYYGGGGEYGGYSEDYARRGRGGREASRQGYEGDYWWLGERAYARERARESYDEGYRRFNEETRPRYSPVSGNYHAMGGEYQYRRPPEPLREERWFSDWTRWF
jgi:hypothetical protein